MRIFLHRGQCLLAPKALQHRRHPFARTRAAKAQRSCIQHPHIVLMEQPEQQGVRCGGE